MKIWFCDEFGNYVKEGWAEDGIELVAEGVVSRVWSKDLDVGKKSNYGVKRIFPTELDALRYSLAVEYKAIESIQYEIAYKNEQIEKHRNHISYIKDKVKHACG